MEANLYHNTYQNEKLDENTKQMTDAHNLNIFKGVIFTLPNIEALLQFCINVHVHLHGGKTPCMWRLENYVMEKIQF